MRRATAKEVELLRRLDEESLAILPPTPPSPFDEEAAAASPTPDQTDPTGDQQASLSDKQAQDSIDQVL